jgi:hypothetical protein
MHNDIPGPWYIAKIDMATGIVQVNWEEEYGRAVMKSTRS